MIEKARSLGHGEIDVLILRALVRKLVAKGVLSPDDVQSLLFEAAKGLDLVGSELTAEAARIIVQVMENAALNAVRAYLEPGESALGTVVDVRHLAATPVGRHVTAEAEVTKVDGRRIVFAVTARDEIEEIGKGIHERMVVDLRRLTQRLDAKSGGRSGR